MKLLRVSGWLTNLEHSSFNYFSCYMMDLEYDCKTFPEIDRISWKTIHAIVFFHNTAPISTDGPSTDSLQ